ncbi:MAG: 30S ribosomal protein S24e [Thermoplasmatota archaeon]
MEIEIESKTDNPLFNRTEIHFIVHHESEKTPKRDLIRSELADKLRVKKETIIVSHMKSSFGMTNTAGYAKVYSSPKEAGKWEKKYVLKRNKALTETKKEEKTEESKTSENTEKLKDTPPEEQKEDQKQVTEEKKE